VRHAGILCHEPEIEGDEAIGILVVVADQRLGAVNIDAQFFLQLAAQCFETFLTGFALATGKFPAPGHVLSRRPLRDEDASLFVEDGAGENVSGGTHEYHGLHSVTPAKRKSID
jgi:hypothetical protein